MKSQGGNMDNDDKRFLIQLMNEIRDLAKEMREFKGEMREFVGEMREFKTHVKGRVEKLEKKEGERSKERLSLFSVLIASAALAVSVIVNFFRGGN